MQNVEIPFDFARNNVVAQLDELASIPYTLQSFALHHTLSDLKAGSDVTRLRKNLLTGRCHQNLYIPCRTGIRNCPRF